jgi:hypothetical protein
MMISIGSSSLLNADRPKLHTVTVVTIVRIRIHPAESNVGLQTERYPRRSIAVMLAVLLS